MKAFNSGDGLIGFGSMAAKPIFSMSFLARSAERNQRTQAKSAEAFLARRGRGFSARVQCRSSRACSYPAQRRRRPYRMLMRRSASAGNSVASAVIRPGLGLQDQDAPVGGIVVNDQQMLAGKLSLRLAKVCAYLGAGAVGARIVKENVVPCAFDALHPDIAAHEHGETLANRQSKARSTVAPRH